MKLATLLKRIASRHKQLVMLLSQHHPQLDQAALNQLAQDVINQCITLQICHDRGISSASYPHLFHAGVDPELIQGTIQWLSGVKQACEISTLPIDLLGHLYEQFLATHWFTLRKAQGAYYTPVAIVDYLIDRTVGVLLHQKTVEDLDNNTLPLKILDPACGSGAFLLKAYQYLLNWYLHQYLRAIDRYQAQLYQQHDGTWHLTTAAKQQILLQHIYGLDINPDAVDVTNRSLLLQLGEGSIAEPINPSNHRSNDAPDPKILQHNIQCGNALIDLDFYQLNQPMQFTPAQVDHINAFSWEKAFPTIMASGGFAVILGNPPWVFTRNAQFSDPVKDYYRIKYFSQVESTQRSKANQTGKVNLFALFLFKSIELMHKDGRMGIVVPNTLLRTTVYVTTRKYILDRCSIEQIVDLGHDAFSRVTAASTALILSKNLEKSTLEFVDAINQTGGPPIVKNIAKKSDFLKNTSYVFSVLLNESQNQLFHRISEGSIALTHLTSEIIEGIVCRKEQIKRQPLSSQYQRILEGKDVERYCLSFRERYILFDRQQLHRPRPDRIWNAKEKIILRRIGGGEFALVGALDTDHYYTFASTNNILLSDRHHYNIRYILALLNSRLLNCYYTQKFTNQSNRTVNIAKTFLEQLPIRAINFDRPAEKRQHDRLVDQVEVLQTLHQQLRITNSAAEQEGLQQQIQSSDRQLDQWVYELYNLTESEIELIKTPATQQVSGL